MISYCDLNVKLDVFHCVLEIWYENRTLGPQEKQDQC